MESYENLPELTIWSSFTKLQLASYLTKFLVGSNTSERNTSDVSTTPIRKLYFIDPVNSFPLQEFQQLLSPDQVNNANFYDNVIIATCLDLTELKGLISNILPEKSKDNNAITQGRQDGDISWLVIINDIDVMFRNSNITDPALAHDTLNSVLLQLRLYANEVDHSFKCVLLCRQRSRGARSAVGDTRKRPFNRGNTTVQFISKYYADKEV